MSDYSYECKLKNAKSGMRRVPAAVECAVWMPVNGDPENGSISVED
jgi:hypothetical protein